MNQVMNKIQKNIHLGSNPKQEAKQALDKVDDLLSSCYGTLSLCLGWTNPNQQVTRGTIGMIFPKYVPTGQKFKLRMTIGQTEESKIDLEIFKTKDDKMNVSVIPMEKLPQAKIDCSPEETISRRPKECINLCYELSVRISGVSTVK